MELLKVRGGSASLDTQQMAETHTGKYPSLWPFPLLCPNLSPSPSLPALGKGGTLGLEVAWDTWLHGGRGEPVLDEDALNQSRCLGAGAGNKDGAFTAEHCQSRGWCVCPGESVGTGVSITLHPLWGRFVLPNLWCSPGIRHQADP